MGCTTSRTSVHTPPPAERPNAVNSDADSAAQSTTAMVVTPALVRVVERTASTSVSDGMRLTGASAGTSVSMLAFDSSRGSVTPTAGEVARGTHCAAPGHTQHVVPAAAWGTHGEAGGGGASNAPPPAIRVPPSDAPSRSSPNEWVAAYSQLRATNHSRSASSTPRGMATRDTVRAWPRSAPTSFRFTAADGGGDPYDTSILPAPADVTIGTLHAAASLHTARSAHDVLAPAHTPLPPVVADLPPGAITMAELPGLAADSRYQYSLTASPSSARTMPRDAVRRVLSRRALGGTALPLPFVPECASDAGTREASEAGAASMYPLPAIGTLRDVCGAVDSSDDEAGSGGSSSGDGDIIQARPYEPDHDS